MRKIIILLEKINEQGLGDIVKSSLGRVAGDVAGGLVTGLSRASGVPFIAGASNISGDIVKKTIDQYINSEDIQKKLKSNYYFYHDEHYKYQGGKFGYDTDLPREKFSPKEITTIKNLVSPSFLASGYLPKFTGKRGDDGLYSLIIFKSGNNLPIRDSRNNPIVYVVPYNIFNLIKDKNSSDIVVKDLLKIYGLIK